MNLKRFTVKILGPKGNRRTEKRLPQHFSIHRHHGSGDSAVNGPMCLPV